MGAPPRRGGQRDDVVIYELVLGDVNGDPTTVLERAHEHLKDNRLTPRACTSHTVYDTTAIVGQALLDPNFNWDEEEEGTGGDIVTYLLPEGWSENTALTVECNVWYQSLPPKWVAPTLAIEGDSLIDGFRQLYAEFAPTPERIASLTFTESWLQLSLTGSPCRPSRTPAYRVNPFRFKRRHHSGLCRDGRAWRRSNRALPSNPTAPGPARGWRYLFRTERGLTVTLIPE